MKEKQKAAAATQTELERHRIICAPALRFIQMNNGSRYGYPSTSHSDIMSIHAISVNIEHLVPKASSQPHADVHIQRPHVLVFIPYRSSQQCKGIAFVC
jgi:hypothetical protein